MKKKLAMVTLLLASTIAATSCNSDEVKPIKTDDGKSVIFTLTNNDGTTEYYCAEDLLADLQDSSAAYSKLYSEVSRQVFTQYGEKTVTETEKATLRLDAEDEVTEFKETCKTNAKAEGTDYDTYLETQLKTKGVETTEELKELFYYEGLKETILEDYIEETGHYNYFLNEYLTTYTPFQVKHILVAANTADTNFKDGTMTPDNARKLLTILNGFIEGDTFANLAKETDDTSSANNDGIMPFNQAQNYVSEFRFATYVQEIFGAHNNGATDEETLNKRFEAAKKLHIVNVEEGDDEAKAKEEFAESSLYSVYSDGIETVSLEAIMKLGEEKVKVGMAGDYNYYNTTVESTDPTFNTPKGNEIPSVAEQPYEMNVSKFDDNGNLNEKYYEEYQLERNVIFNNTLNTHEVKYIALGSYASTMTANKTKVNGVDVLADDSGNPIFVALASTGIHFMSMVWNANNPVSSSVTSSLKPETSTEALASFKKIIEDQTGAPVTGELTAQQINQAYFTLYDSDSDLADNLNNYKYTYIGRNGAYKTKSTLDSNSDSLLSDISSYVSSVEYRLFNAIVYDNVSDLVIGTDNFYDIRFFDYNETEYKTQAEYEEKSELYNAVKDFVQDSIESTSKSFAETVAVAAKTYGEKLAREDEVESSGSNWYK